MDSNTQPSVPELRFPEFVDDWEIKHGKEMFVNSRARGHADLPTYSVTLTQGLVPRDSLAREVGKDAAAETNLKASPGDLVYNMMRMWQGAVGRAETECMVSPAYVVLSPKAQIDSLFFDYYLKRSRSIYDLWAYSYGLTSDRLRLYFRDFGMIRYSVPALEEQQKIASTFQTIDQKLAKLKEKHTLLKTWKKGMMQKLFSQEIRFKREDGSEFPGWEEKRFREVFNRVTRKNTEKNQNILTISAQLGLLSQEDYFNKSVAAKDVSGYYFLRKGEFAYNKSYSNGYPLGAIKKLNKYETGVVSTLYICFSSGEEITSAFFEQYFEHGGLNHEIHKIAQEGARNHGLLNVSVVEFFNDIKIPYPTLEEQKKIADFLLFTDQKIEAVALQIQTMEAFKKGLLQKMFV